MTCFGTIQGVERGHHLTAETSQKILGSITYFCIQDGCDTKGHVTGLGTHSLACSFSSAWPYQFIGSVYFPLESEQKLKSLPKFRYIYRFYFFPPLWILFEQLYYPYVSQEKILWRFNLDVILLPFECEVKIRSCDSMYESVNLVVTSPARSFALSLVLMPRFHSSGKGLCR